MKLEPDAGAPERSALRDPQSVILELARQLASLTVDSQRADILAVLYMLFCSSCGRLRAPEEMTGAQIADICEHWREQMPVQGVANLIRYVDARQTILTQYANAIRSLL